MTTLPTINANSAPKKSRPSCEGRLTATGLLNDDYQSYEAVNITERGVANVSGML